MPLNNSYDEQAVVQAIASALETFYGTLIEKIDGLNIQKVMKRKNPYLYRAKAMQSATEIVDSVLTAFVSSSEETIFGNCFFEPIAIAASGGNKALAEGIDIMIQNNETNTIRASGHARQDGLYGAGIAQGHAAWLPGRRIPVARLARTPGPWRHLGRRHGPGQNAADDRTYPDARGSGGR